MPADFSKWDESDMPSDFDRKFKWTIKRAPPDRAITFVVLSHKHYGVYTHYMGGRTTPHLKENCPCQNELVEPRWMGYVLATLSGSHEDVVFEFPPKAAEIIKKAEGDYPSLRGLVITALRPSGKTNGKVHLTIKNQRFNPAEIKAEEPIRPILAHIWGFKDSVRPIEQAFTPDAISEQQKVSEGMKIDNRIIVPEVFDLVGDLSRNIGLDPQNNSTNSCEGKNGRARRK